MVLGHIITLQHRFSITSVFQYIKLQFCGEAFCVGIVTEKIILRFGISHMKAKVQSGIALF